MGRVYLQVDKRIGEEHVPAVLGFRRSCNLAKPSNRWRTDGGQAMGHDSGWKVYIDEGTTIVRVEDRWGLTGMATSTYAGIDGDSAFCYCRLWLFPSQTHRLARSLTIIVCIQYTPPSSTSCGLRQLQYPLDTPLHPCRILRVCRGPLLAFHGLQAWPPSRAFLNVGTIGSDFSHILCLIF